MGLALDHAMNAACNAASELLDQYAPVEIRCERYVEREPHPGGQAAYTMRARFPWHREPHTRVMVEVTMDEEVLREPVECRVMHEYGEDFDAQVHVYSLEEIVAEKLRAVLQHARKLSERGWSRSRARDFYDVWRILGTHEGEMDLDGFAELLSKKCSLRGVAFTSPDDFFQATMLAHVERTWEQWLGPLVPRLPSFETVIRELRPRIATLCQ